MKYLILFICILKCFYCCSVQSRTDRDSGEKLNASLLVNTIENEHSNHNTGETVQEDVANIKSYIKGLLVM